VFVERLAAALGIDRIDGTAVAKSACEQLRHGWPAADVVAKSLVLTGQQSRMFTNLAVSTYCADWRPTASPPSQAPKPVPPPTRTGPAPAPHRAPPKNGTQPQEPEIFGDEPWMGEVA
jgi:hypothetical protein